MAPSPKQGHAAAQRHSTPTVDEEPLRGRNGVVRGEVTLPEYRIGRPAANKGMDLKTQVYSPAEMYAVLEQFDTSTPCGIRDAAITAFAWRTAGRIDEVLSTQCRDVDLERLVWFVRFPKRDRLGRAVQRNVPLEEPTAEFVQRWLTCRDELGIPRGETPLFCVVLRPSRGKKLLQSTYRERLKLAGKKAGIEKRVHPHGLRATCACDLHFDEGAPIMTTMEWLGHADVRSTVGYLQKLGAGEASSRWARDRNWPGKPGLLRTPDTAPPGATPDLLKILADALAAPELLAQLAAAIGRDHHNSP